jgi:hypothetical protein
MFSTSDLARRSIIADLLERDVIIVSTGTIGAMELMANAECLCIGRHHLFCGDCCDWQQSTG